MGTKYLVCQGATCRCNYGTVPDKLKVLTQRKRYINDKDGITKLMATHKDLGATFEKNTFGSCKKQPTVFGYKTCQAVVAEWTGFYDKITLTDNDGHALLEDSKGSCPIGGKDCIAIVQHGQEIVLTAQNVHKAAQEVLLELFPFAAVNNEDLLSINQEGYE
ncbi:DUF4280 domain-containing protein [Sphingobacterium sp. MYb382]|uniref:DUF4280 domain-containing protein n=1 Tax=Sphingobacterium sp. MYb382 TaxID=2745278 RepID=UPI0030AE454D